MDKENYTPKFEQQIKDKLNQLEASPRPIVWDRIEAALDQSDNKTILIPFWQNAAAIFGGLAIGFSLMLFSLQKSAELATVNDSNPTEISQSSIPNREISNTANTANTSIASVNSQENHSTNMQSVNEANSTSPSNGKISSVDQAMKNQVAKENTISDNPFNAKKTLDRKSIAQKRKFHANGNHVIPRADEPLFIQRNNEIIVLEVIGENKMVVQRKEDVLEEELKNPVFDLKSPKKQMPVIKGFYAGVNGGANTSFIFYSSNSTNPIFNQKSSIVPGLGFTYGLTLGYDFNNKIGLQTGFNYTRYNSSFTQPMNDYTFIGSMSIFQFDIPLIFKYKWQMGLGKNQNPFTIAALLGLKYSNLHHYYLQAKLQSNTVSNQYARVEQDDKSYNQNQLGYLMGVEMKYFFKKNWSFHAALTSNLSTDISQFPIFLNNTREKPIQLGMSSEIGVQYHFPFKKKKTTK